MFKFEEDKLVEGRGGTGGGVLVDLKVVGGGELLREISSKDGFRDDEDNLESDRLREGGEEGVRVLVDDIADADPFEGLLKESDKGMPFSLRLIFLLLTFV